MRGLRTKLIMLTYNLPLSSYDIYIFSETWLNNNFHDSELGFGDYQIYRQDRKALISSSNRGGGVLIAIRRSLTSKRLAIKNNNTETLFVSVSIKKTKYVICGTYIPPRAPLGTYESFVESLEEISQIHHSSHLLIFGDFNIGRVNWGATSIDPLPSRQAECLKNAIICHDLTQKNQVPNQDGNILDLVLSDTHNVDITLCSEPLVNVDGYHPPLHVVLNIKKIKRQLISTSNNPTVTYRCFKKANFTLLNQALSDINWVEVLDTSSLDDVIAEFYSQITRLIDLYVPQVQISNFKFPEWMSPQLKNLILEKKIAHKNFKQTKEQHFLNSFNNLRQQCKALSQSEYSAHVRKIESLLEQNPRRLWQFINKNKTNTLVPAFYLKGESASKPDEIANLFAKHFSSVYSCEQLASPDFDFNSKTTVLTPLTQISVNENSIFEKLKSLKNISSSGPDKIPPCILKNCANSLVTPLHIIFNKSLSEGVFPTAWKVSYITPLLKSGDSSNIENFRPVAKLSALPKLFEALVHEKLQDVLVHVINKNQHGFIKNKSVVSNLTLFTQYAMETVESGSQLDVCYLDYSRAFDKLNINIFITKLEALGVRRPMLQWLLNFLSNRQQIVKYNRNSYLYTNDADSYLKSSSSTFHEHLSAPFDVLSGCPQGGHLSGLLYDIYSNDLDCFIQEGDGLKFWQYADDLRICAKVTTPMDCNLLQNALNNIQKWSECNKMQLNVTKCKIMIFHRKQTPVFNTYTLNDRPLECVTQIRDLGIIYQPDLKFNIHIAYIVNKAYRVLSYLIRNTRLFRNPITVYILYCSLVRSILEFGSVIWSPQYQNLIGKVEQVQRKFLRYYAFKHGVTIENHDYTHIMTLGKTKITTLKSRRELLDILFLTKILRSQINCPELLEQINFRINCRNIRNQNLFTPDTYTTNISQNSPMNRLMLIGNTFLSRSDVDLLYHSLHQIKDKYLNTL